MSNEVIELHLPVEVEGKAVALLASNSGLSNQQVKQVMQKGAVWLETAGHVRRLRRASRLVKPGESLHLYYDAEVLQQQPAEAELIADQGSFSVWYKPSGMLSQGSKWGDHCTIVRWAEQHLVPERPAFSLHRLDRAASGLILLAHQKKMAAKLSTLFEERKIEKCYRVLVEGCFPDDAEPRVIRQDLDGKPARSVVSVVGYNEKQNRSLLDVVIETGRKHQIRRHLAALGFPVVGDRLYGAADATSELDLQLTAAQLQFIHPDTGEALSYRLPDDRLPAL